MNQTLIIDAGSSKADWALISDKGVRSLSTEGYNPYTHSVNRLEKIAANAMDQFQGLVHDIYYYGSGVSGSHIDDIRAQLASWIGCERVHVTDDLVGAARSVCQRSAGLVAIAGTGSNLCHFDGIQIVRRSPNLGYILGDEGSGNHLGRLLVKKHFYGTLPRHLSKQFNQRFPKLNRNSFLSELFNSEHPNSFLAQFAKFIHAQRQDIYIHSLILQSFKEFIQNHIIPLSVDSDLAVHFVGSIGYRFQSEWIKALSEFNIQVGTFLERPIDGLIEYHKSN